MGLNGDTARDGDGARILVVDDEDSITQLLCTALRYEGFETASAATGREALTQAAAFRPDLVLLDVMLPDLDGFEVHRRLTGGSSDRLPVVFLTARRETDDRIRGLTIGADDYVVKPFSLEELIARVRAVLRRTRAADEPRRRMVFEDLELDEETREVRRAGRLIELTPTEFSLLRYLLGPQQGPDPRPRLELRLRRRLERRRDLHQLPAQEDRPLGGAADPHDARLRLLAAPAPALRARCPSAPAC